MPVRPDHREAEAAIGLIDLTARYLDAGFHVAIEGILYADMQAQPRADTAA